MSEKLSTALALLGLALAAACATPVNRNLARAEAQYAAAAADPAVRTYAANPLRDAWEALERARQAAASREPAAEVDHLAYLASRRVEIATVSAERYARTAVVPSSDAARRIETLTAELSAALTALRASRSERGVVITVEDVLFDPGRTTLRSDALPDLDRVVGFLRVHPDLEAQVEGHTDGSEADLRLSLARAEAVERYLVAGGIDPRRIATSGRGAADPVDSDATPLGRQRNRRVEIVVVD
jgi:outer membrane protein OmpA-like peptidoglycan-associated protein